MTWSLVWAAIAAALVIGEMFTGEFTMLSLAIGFAAASVVSGFGLGLVPASAAALVFSVLSLFVMAPYLRRVVAPRHTPDPVEAMIGTEVLVIEAIAPPGFGKVKMDGVIWTAEADHPIAEGTRVMVAEVLGARLRVMGQSEFVPHRPVQALESPDAEAERLRRLAADEAQRQS